jgi:hypothetical protein
VISISDDGKTDQRGYPTPNQPHGSPPPASQSSPTRQE